MEKGFHPFMGGDTSDDDDDDSVTETCSRSDLRNENSIDNKELSDRKQKCMDRLLELQKRHHEMSEKFSRRTTKSLRGAKQVTANIEVKEKHEVTESRNLESSFQKGKPSSISDNSDVKNSDNKTWSELRSFLTINDHLVNHCSDGNAQSGLEKQIEEAITKKDFDAAVTLSDQLANREFGSKIVAAIDAREYTKKRKQEVQEKAKRHKKKLCWGFQHKQRWETKGNM